MVARGLGREVMLIGRMSFLRISATPVMKFETSGPSYLVFFSDSVYQMLPEIYDHGLA